MLNVRKCPDNVKNHVIQEILNKDHNRVAMGFTFMPSETSLLCSSSSATIPEVSMFITSVTKERHLVYSLVFFLLLFEPVR